LALSIVPKGGLFIAGGIASKIINLMTEAIFMTSFLHKDQMKSVLQTIPVHIVTDSNIGLMGAGVYSFIPQKDKFCLSR
jgi:glucokinase